MVVIETNVDGKKLYLDGKLLQKLENVKKIVMKKNFDCVILIDGLERIGKSTLGITIGTYLDPNLSPENIASDSDDAVKKIESLPDKSVLIMDEGSLMLSSKDSMKSENKKLTKILNVVGQKNMVIIIILPSVFELNRYIATTRARFLLHAYADEGLNRGRFSYFGTKKLKQLYHFGKKNFGSYAKPEADFLGRFTNYKPSWYDKYLEVKKKSLISALKEDVKKSPMQRKWAYERDALITLIIENGWMTQRELIRRLDEYGVTIKPPVMSQLITQFKEGLDGRD